MPWIAASALVLAPLAGVLIWALMLRHVALAPEAAGARIATPSDALPLIGWARALSAPAARRREALWRAGIELAAVGVAVWALLTLPASLVWPSCALGWLLLAAGAIDAREGLLPDEINLAIAALGLVQAALPGERALLDAVIGAAAGLLVLAAFAAGYARLRGREGLGLGDAKLLGALGAWVGWQGLAGVVMVAAALGLAWAALEALARRRPMRGDLSLPLGPFLALGGWLIWVYGPIGLAGAA